MQRQRRRRLPRRPIGVGVWDVSVERAAFQRWLSKIDATYVRAVAGSGSSRSGDGAGAAAALVGQEALEDGDERGNLFRGVWVLVLLCIRM